MPGEIATPSSVQEAVNTAFECLVQLLPSELATVALSGWTESVLRYFYCRCLAVSHPEIVQFVECDKIDLVLRQGASSAFVEFKFYRHPVRFDPYDGRVLGYKGGPSLKNLAEFRACVEKLYERRVIPGLSKIHCHRLRRPRGRGEAGFAVLQTI